jgi:hypothetical protein
MTKQRQAKGFTYRRPDGTLSSEVFEDVSYAQEEAAFASKRPYSYISMPSDWKRAYRQGFRIVRATIVAGRSHRAWKDAV